MAVSGAERDTIADSARQLGLAALVRAMEVLGRTQVEMRDAPDPRVNLELALVRLAHPEVDESPEALLARIERLEQGGVVAPASAGSIGPSTVPHLPAAGVPVPAAPAPAAALSAPVGEQAPPPVSSPSPPADPGPDPTQTVAGEEAAGERGPRPHPGRRPRLPARRPSARRWGRCAGSRRRRRHHRRRLLRPPLCRQHRRPWPSPCRSPARRRPSRTAPAPTCRPRHRRVRAR